MDILGKNNTILAKNAIVDFFFPVVRFGEFLKDVSLSASRNKEILSMLGSIESKIAESERSQLKFLETSKRLDITFHDQSNLFSHLSNELSQTRKFLSEEFAISVDLENYPYSMSSSVSSIVNKVKYLETRELVSGGELTRTAAEIGLANIEYILKGIVKKEKKIPHLFGINKGGGFLANFISHRIGLHEKYLVKCDYRAEFEKIYCENREIDGPIVILDDVTRSGETLRKVKDYLVNTYPASNIFSIVLVMSCQDKHDSDEVHKIVDYSPWITKHSTVTLPWSRNFSDLIESSDYFDDIEMDQIVGRLKFNDHT